MKTKYLLLFFCTFFVNTPSFAYSFEYGGIYYDRVGDEEARVVSGSTSYAGNVEIPQWFTYLDVNYTVTSIGNSAFHGCDGLRSVTIPITVTSIGDEAFIRCSALTSVVIPNSVTRIGQNAFSGCSRLTSVTISNSVTSISYNLFSGCSSLTSVRIPNSVTRIGDYAFQSSGLTSVTIPNSVTSIGKGTFGGCTNLTSVTIPNSVTSIGESAFSNCSGLTSVFVENPTPISIADNVFPTGFTLYVPRGSKEAYSAAAGWNNSTNIIERGQTPTIIPFADANVKAICVAKWDRNGDGELSEDEAAAVTSLGIAFKYNSTITSFDELQYFTRVKSLDYAFYNCTGLTSVTIPDCVTSIGEYAFSGCSGLTSVTIPDCVTSIGESAFSGCSGLTSVHITDLASWCQISFSNPEANPLDLAHHLYLNNQEINDLIIPDGMTSIPKYAFMNCTYLTSVMISNNMKTIEESAFSGCSGLTSVIIPGNVTSIGDNAFYGCNNLINVSVQNPTPIQISSDVFSNRANATLFVLTDCKTAYQTANFWNEFQTIEEQSFTFTLFFSDYDVEEVCVNKWDKDGDGKLSIAEVTSVTELGSAFSYNTTITSFNELQYFTGISSIEERAFYGCSGLTSITIPNSVTSIGNYAFQNCSGLSSVTIPNSVTSIGQTAFKGCSRLTSVTISNSLTSIGAELFYGCTILKSVTIPNSVTSIGKSAFSGCSGLTSVTIPNSVTSIGVSAFSGCSGLTSVTIPNSVTSIGVSAFSGCSGLTSITIPNSVTEIGSSVFSGCSGLTSVTIPNSVTFIYSNAFKNCTGLTSVTIPNSVTSIGQNAFYGCTGLTSVTIPNSVTSIGEGTFCGCSGLTSVTIPNSVTSIGNNTFYYCSGLTSVTIPNSVTSIGEGSFNYCSRLTSVTVDLETPLSISSDVFSNRAKATLYVPAGCKAAYEAADYWKEFKEILEIGAELTGDLNGDESVDVGDIMAIINLIVDGSYSATADLNSDGSVDVGDIMAVINIIIDNFNNSASVKAMIGVTGISPNYENDDHLTLTYKDNIVGVQLDNNIEYSAFQMKVTLPDGVDIDAVQFDSNRLDGFTKSVRKVRERQYMIIGFSMDGDIIAGSTGEILNIRTSDNVSNNIIISDPIFSTPEAKTYKLKVAASNTTGIPDVQLAQMNVKGNTLYVHASGDTTLNIYSISGALYEQKHLHSGVNTIALSRGQYIINNQKIIISK